MNTASHQLSAREFRMRPGLPDRVTAAEVKIEAILRAHGLKFAINQVKVGDNVIHQEIVLVDRGD